MSIGLFQKNMIHLIPFLDILWQCIRFSEKDKKMTYRKPKSCQPVLWLPGLIQISPIRHGVESVHSNKPGGFIKRFKDTTGLIKYQK